MLQPLLKKNDKLAYRLIGLVSLIVFIAVLILKNIQLEVDLGFNIHIFAKINSVINGTVSVLLVLALVAVKWKKYELHKKLMLLSILLSVLFLLTYIAHHALAGETRYPVDAPYRSLYLVVLLSHIFLAAIILPFILYTAYRGLTSEFASHRKIARITWPIWLYVAVTGVVVYLMISPYYS
jgi:putative membrane protein